MKTGNNNNDYNNKKQKTKMMKMKTYTNVKGLRMKRGMIHMGNTK